MQEQPASSACISELPLWIAFKLVSLQCKNNLFYFFWRQAFVVNCFQISIFAVQEQPFVLSAACCRVLWIAFKLVSLQCKNNWLRLNWQTALLWIAFKLVSLQCKNNLPNGCSQDCLVVNCFQISIFAVQEQPMNDHICVPILLWIAFKLVSLQCKNNLSCEYFFSALSCELLSN